MSTDEGIRWLAGTSIPAWRMVLAQMDPDETARQQYTATAWADANDPTELAAELAKIAAKALHGQYGELAVKAAVDNVGVRLDALDVWRQEQFKEIIGDSTRR
jgi:hypothetical protein